MKRALKKNNTFFIVFQGLSFGEKKKKIDKKEQAQALSNQS